MRHDDIAEMTKFADATLPPIRAAARQRWRRVAPKM
jgi:hypothetical protein